MKSVGVVGINLNKISSMNGHRALTASGNNFGNMLFTKAAYQQVKNPVHVNFKPNPEHIKNKCSSLLIPAANWINPNSDWGDLANSIEESGLQCTVVGLGTQLPSIKDVSSISDGTKRLLNVLSHQSNKIGVRGDFTAEVLSKLGINNVEVLGCPSIYMSGGAPSLRKINLESNLRLGIGPTRYMLKSSDLLERNDKQRQLYQFAIRQASSIYYQSEQFEIDVLSKDSIDNQQLEQASAYYGIYGKNELEGLILEKGKYHTSVDGWLADVRKDDVYIGTRIHGAIAATLAGTMPILITHDNRTRELAEFMGVPNIPISDFNLEMLYDINSIVKSLDYDNFLNRSRLNLSKIIKFYNDNSLEHNLGQV